MANGWWHECLSYFFVFVNFSLLGLFLFQDVGAKAAVWCGAGQGDVLQEANCHPQHPVSLYLVS
jgi:hypothetical protein